MIGSVSVSNAAAAAAAAKAVKSQDRKLKGKAGKADKVTLELSNDASKIITTTTDNKKV